MAGSRSSLRGLEKLAARGDAQRELLLGHLRALERRRLRPELEEPLQQLDAHGRDR